MRSLTINGRVIDDRSPAYVVAEIGGNHGGSVETACTMIRVAAACGAHAAKFQRRTNRTLYSEALLNQPYENENSFGKTYGEHREALELSLLDYPALQAEAARSKIACFATVFDEQSADDLMSIGVPAIKIASGGLTDDALLAHVAALDVPIILSTGGGTLRDIHRAVSILTRHHGQLAILHCCASYPVRDWSEHNLRCITTLRDEYQEFVIGWSGHDNGIAMAVAAYTLGARIIEKHFTLNRASRGTDHPMSLEPAGLGKMCRDLTRAHEALGDGRKRWYQSEVAPISKMRRRETPEGWKITGEKDVPTVD